MSYSPHSPRAARRAALVASMQEPQSLDDPDAWASVVQAANPAALLVAIRARLGPALAALVLPDDIWQETLLRAWRQRASLQWLGISAFRRWLLSIAEHCIEDSRDHWKAGKRDAARTRRFADAADAEGAVEPWASTTPSRIAAAREMAAAMQTALESLPDDVRDVVRLRLFDELTIEEVAARLGLGESAVRHRFRRGAEHYRDRLRDLITTSRRPPTADESTTG